MLNLKPIDEVRKEFEQEVTNKISSAQEAGTSPVYFTDLPNSIITQLKDLGYPVTPAQNGGFCVTVL
jgi:hypothetical protein